MEIAYTIGFSYRKRRIAKYFIANYDIKKYDKKCIIKDGDIILIWGSDAVPKTIKKNASIYRVEDGFLRSLGLGSQLAVPHSWVFDQKGIYYDASKTSSLEKLLLTKTFTKQDIERAKKIKKLYISNDLNKYNLEEKHWPKPRNLTRTNKNFKKPIIFIPGQVETDASIKYGSVDIKTNLELVSLVRKNNPNAYIAYKTHPDISRGMRKAEFNKNYFLKYCDAIIDDTRINNIFRYVDEVHTITSLAGFEALIHNKKVYCYGLPFYAGWGLTTDRHSFKRRSRKLTLEALIAGSLIYYPKYIDINKKKICQVEKAIANLTLLKKQKKEFIVGYIINEITKVIGKISSYIKQK